MNSSRSKSAALGFGGGIAVFILCSIVQAVGGSSMFQTEYYKPDNLLLDIAMNVTFYPGWGITILLLLKGVGALLSKDEPEQAADQAGSGQG